MFRPGIIPKSTAWLRAIKAQEKVVEQAKRDEATA